MEFTRIVYTRSTDVVKWLGEGRDKRYDEEKQRLRDRVFKPPPPAQGYDPRAPNPHKPPPPTPPTPPTPPPPLIDYKPNWMLVDFQVAGGFYLFTAFLGAMAYLTAYCTGLLESIP